MTSTPWFRFYNEAINDPKLKRISVMTKQPRALINGVWVGVLCLASESPERGELLISEGMPYLIEEIIDAVGVDFEIGEFIIDHLLKFGLLSFDGEVYSIAQWDKRQFKSDNSAERVKKHRAKKSQQSNNSSNLNGTGDIRYPKRDSNVECNVTETPPDTESETYIDNTAATAPTHEEIQEDEPKDEFAQCVDLLNHRGLSLDSFTGQLVQDCFDDISPAGTETKLDWFRYACEESAGMSRISWKFFDTVIRSVNASKSLAAHRANKPQSKHSGKQIYIPSSMRQPAPQVQGEF